LRFNFNKEQFYFLVSALVSRFIHFIKLSKSVNSILVIKWDEIGDMVYALHVFNHLKIQYPDAKITLVCKEFVTPLVQHNSAIDYIRHELPKNEKFDLIVELRGNWDTLRYALFNLPNRRVDRGTVRLANKLKGGQKHETITNFEIVEPLLAIGTHNLIPHITIDENSEKYAQAFIAQHQLNKFAVFHCGARRILRQWPLENFAKLAIFLKENYDFKIVFAGTMEDEQAINEIISLGKLDAIVCTKNFSLLHFASLVKNASLFIGNESGPLHIAATVNTPLVGIYGPGVKDIFYPIGKQSLVVHHVLDCNPCDQIHCVRPENPCINLVTLFEVETKIEQLLGIGC